MTGARVADEASEAAGAGVSSPENTICPAAILNVNESFMDRNAVDGAGRVIRMGGKINSFSFGASICALDYVEHEQC